MIHLNKFPEHFLHRCVARKFTIFTSDNFDFACFDPSRAALSIQWLVNGTLLENSRLVNMFREYNDRSKTADLSFDLPLEHNLTTIQCIGNFASENVSSESITLLLQGQLLLPQKVMVTPE